MDPSLCFLARAPRGRDGGARAARETVRSGEGGRTRGRQGQGRSGPGLDVALLAPADPPGRLAAFLDELKAAEGEAALEQAFFKGVVVRFRGTIAGLADFRALQGVPLQVWAEYAFWDPERYTRNLLAAQQRFSLILLCWEPVIDLSSFLMPCCHVAQCRANTRLCTRTTPTAQWRAAPLVTCSRASWC